MIDFTKLLPILSQSKTQKDNPPLYQVIEQMLSGLKDISNSINKLSQQSNDSAGAIIAGSPVTLTHNLILTWPTTSDITLVNGSSSAMFIPDFVVIHADTRAGAYTNLAADGYITLATQSPGTYEMGNYIINDGTGFNGTGLTQLLGTGNTAVAVLREQIDVPVGYGSIVSVQGNDQQVPLFVRLFNSAGNLTGGNASNKVQIIPFYIRLTSFQ